MVHSPINVGVVYRSYTMTTPITDVYHLDSLLLQLVQRSIIANAARTTTRVTPDCRSRVLAITDAPRLWLVVAHVVALIHLCQGCTICDE